MRKTQRSDRLNPAAPATNAAPGTNLKRRGFLLALGAGGAGAAAIAAQKISRTIEPAGTAAAPADGKGYSVTEHVRRYYRTMKV
ncbi:MAG: formate dehydrogenase [Betaproteobacteria bacterium]